MVRFFGNESDSVKIGFKQMLGKAAWEYRRQKSWVVNGLHHDVTASLQHCVDQSGQATNFKAYWVSAVSATSFYYSIYNPSISFIYYAPAPVGEAGALSSHRRPSSVCPSV